MDLDIDRVRISPGRKKLLPRLDLCSIGWLLFANMDSVLTNDGHVHSENNDHARDRRISCFCKTIETSQYGLCVLFGANSSAFAILWIGTSAVRSESRFQKFQTGSENNSNISEAIVLSNRFFIEQYPQCWMRCGE